MNCPEVMLFTDMKIIRLLLFPTLLAFALSPPTLAYQLYGRVIGITDGDTVTILDERRIQHKVRLSGIDAPEQKQPFGDASKRNLSSLIFSRYVAVIYNKRDRHGRIVGKILLNGRDICLEQIRAGLAWHFKEYEREQSPEERRAYAEAEEEAHRARRGLWRDPFPIPPWEFRHPERARQENGPTTPPGLAGRLPVIGNKRSKTYHRPDCPDYDRVAPQNRVPFRAAEEAETAGYRKAGNCP
jgi:endonuclease YncB( thermonuclease family)